jgi:putative Holliday junction resolvase
MNEDDGLGLINQNPAGTSGRILGIDPGERRIGIALSDPSGILATGTETLDARNWDALINKLLEIVNREGIRTVVIGNPLTLKGKSNVLSPLVNRLAKFFSTQGLEVVLWDERFSSEAARRILKIQGIKTGHHKDDVNRKAAEWILQTYLESKI